MKYVRAVYFWVFFIAWTLLLFSFICIHKLVFTVLAKPDFDRRCHQYAVLWSKGLFAAMPAWKIDIQGMEYLPASGEAVVIAANHESMADIWALFVLGIQFRWLSKAEVFDIPVIGLAMRWADYIPIKRGDKSSHVKALAASSDRLQRGIPMVFFPEGTRSEDGTMRPFKIGAFKLADENQVPILPVALKGAGSLMRKGSGLPFPATVRVQVLPACVRDSDEGYEDYAARVRSAIMDVHRKL